MGWVVGVMVEVAGEPVPLRHYFAVGEDERSKAEWVAVDHALPLGAVCSSPVGHLEPVEALRHLPPVKMKKLGLGQGQVRALGSNLPRRWLSG
jgi:hypothetical protein